MKIKYLLSDLLDWFRKPKISDHVQDFAVGLREAPDLFELRMEKSWTGELIVVIADIFGDVYQPAREIRMSPLEMSFCVWHMNVRLNKVERSLLLLAVRNFLRTK